MPKTRHTHTSNKTRSNIINTWTEENKSFKKNNLI